MGVQVRVRLAGVGMVERCSDHPTGCHPAGAGVPDSCRHHPGLEHLHDLVDRGVVRGGDRGSGPGVSECPHHTHRLRDGERQVEPRHPYRTQHTLSINPVREGAAKCRPRDRVDSVPEHRGHGSLRHRRPGRQTLPLCQVGKSRTKPTSRRVSRARVVIGERQLRVTFDVGAGGVAQQVPEPIPRRESMHRHHLDHRPRTVAGLRAPQRHAHKEGVQGASQDRLNPEQGRRRTFTDFDDRRTQMLGDLVAAADKRAKTTVSTSVQDEC